MAAAVAGAAHVVLTDLGDLVPLLESNAHSVDCIVSQEHSGGGDGAATAKNASVEILRFEWGVDDETFAGKFDCVIASDCLYSDESSPLFCATLAKVCTPRCMVLMAYKKRIPEREIPFFEMLHKDFDIVVAPQAAIQPSSLRNTGIYVCALRRRSSP